MMGGVRWGEKGVDLEKSPGPWGYPIWESQIVESSSFGPTNILRLMSSKYPSER